ncbi:hypothetical protein G6F68_017319 [Rhizopus microsporus]|nr:hypothetical protein G6F68_017319 [Rhizopus microsporus]
MGRGQDRELVARGQQQLRAHVAVVEAAHRVLLRADGAVGARALVGVVAGVIAMLVQGRHAERRDVVDRATEAAIDRHAVVGRVAGADAAGVVLSNPAGRAALPPGPRHRPGWTSAPRVPAPRRPG